MKTEKRSRKILAGIGILVMFFLWYSPGQICARQEQTEAEQEATDAENETKGDEQTTDLLEMSLEELMSIEVTTASKEAEKVQEAPGVMTVITAREIERFGGVNLMEVLEGAANIYPTSSHLYRKSIISMRGILTTHHNKHTLILLNGRPVREGLEGGVGFPFLLGFPLEMIEKIEIIRGPGSVL